MVAVIPGVGPFDQPVIDVVEDSMCVAATSEGHEMFYKSVDGIEVGSMPSVGTWDVRHMVGSFQIICKIRVL